MEDISRKFPLSLEIPLDSDRKKMSTVRDTPHDALLVCEKGAPDVILKDCTKSIAKAWCVTSWRGLWPQPNSNFEY